MTASQTNRISSVDILRGLVMIIMALDHARDFLHVTAATANPMDPATTTIPLFFTRWITHFCAPVFVFLSGVSVYLSSRNKTVAASSSFLLKRGLWLILVEIAIVSLGLTFDPLYHFIILQVIWAIGCSMLLLALLMRVAPRLILPAGLLLVFGHDALQFAGLPQAGVAGYLWKLFFTAFGTVLPLGNGHFIGIFYAILPWTGVMFLGYSIGRWYSHDVDALKRKQKLLQAGLGVTALYIVLRVINYYGDPAPWQKGNHFLQSFFSFLNTSKYPPSLQYLCMTLGPALLVLALTENVNTTLSRILTVFGRVPFFYYILHLYLLHIALVIVFFATGHTTAEIVDPNSIFLFRPVKFGISLAGVYAIWFSVVVILYFPCRWFNRYKMKHSQWWLRYV